MAAVSATETPTIRFRDPALAPSWDKVRAGDRLILYGRTPRIAELDRRAA
ncbi:MAG: hypothetical protein IH804_03040, partial [Planctomycetes bacterium]|nr:hypothetical protein [Planctomycetota bacterium]